MPTVSRHVSASASGSASKRAPTAPGLGLQDSGGVLGGRGEPCGFAAALGRRWRAAHNSTGPTTAKRDTHLTRKRSGLHLTNALLWSRVSGPPLPSRSSQPSLRKALLARLSPALAVISCNSSMAGYLRPDSVRVKPIVAPAGIYGVAATKREFR